MSTNASNKSALGEQALKIAVESVRTAGEIQRAHFGKPAAVDEILRHDVKLQVDKLCEKAIARTILAAFPDHSIIGEEGGAVLGSGNYVWIVDPLDGTVNYFHGIPYYCSCVACFQRTAPRKEETLRLFADLGLPIAAAVFAVADNELYSAVAGGGAFCNGEPLKPMTTKKLSEALVGVSFGNTEQTVRHMLRCSEILLPHVRKLRNFGAVALDIVNVARGRLGALYQRGVYEWDLAAPGLILREAGGVMDAKEYSARRWEVLAAAPGLHGEIKSLLSSL